MIRDQGGLVGEVGGGDAVGWPTIGKRRDSVYTLIHKRPATP